MANNYFRTSLELNRLTDEEAKWLGEEYARLNDESDESEPEEGMSWHYDDHGYTEWTLVLHGQNDGQGMYRERIKSAHIYAETTFDMAQLCEYLRRFLEKFRPRNDIFFTYAGTCDKMRPDEFYGGTVRVTKNGFDNCHGDCLKNPALRLLKQENIEGRLRLADAINCYECGRPMNVMMYHVNPLLCACGARYNVHKWFSLERLGPADE